MTKFWRSRRFVHGMCRRSSVHQCFQFESQGRVESWTWCPVTSIFHFDVDPVYIMPFFRVKKKKKKKKGFPFYR
jgi:hypothetical protein